MAKLESENINEYVDNSASYEHIEYAGKSEESEHNSNQEDDSHCYEESPQKPLSDTWKELLWTEGGKVWRTALQYSRVYL